MKLVIDSANVESIKKLVDFFPIDGVTTNPSIVVKEQKPFLPLLKEIRSVIGEEKELFAQTIAGDAEGMAGEARWLCEAVSGNVVVKIPVTFEGIKAIKMLKAEGIRTLATTVYTPMNAYLAAKAGADYVAPYVNRIDNLTGNGAKVVAEITEIFSKHNLSCEVLAASFKNVQQIHNVCLAGAHGITAAPELIEALVKIPSIEDNVESFRQDWIGQYGEGSLF
ncbi:fructose-6-phosphate aldolase [Bacillus sp. UMB0728]|uniref:fructose-6-phosphate aldolase n=1 Tax=Bacillus sp. UMB0728 TaxID=2066052 RepID=UPI000C7660AB|nr:fructose-6-phosphate aldolase [Bacillus sp. UMB0728]PLR73568.1 fructose-6-phosphate aldolase [Bacillus sp. UMB0728]